MFRIVEETETMKEYINPKEFLCEGHECEVLVTQWSEKPSIIACRNLYSDSNNIFASIEIVNFINRKGIFPTFYMVMYLRNNLIQQPEPEKPLS